MKVPFIHILMCLNPLTWYYDNSVIEDDVQNGIGLVSFSSLAPSLAENIKFDVTGFGRNI